MLLSYNVIEQRVDTPIVCHGFSLFDNGHLVFFKRGDEPQKHHALQIWQTPYVGKTSCQHAKTDSLLFKIGNQDIVRGMAECHEIIGLTQRTTPTPTCTSIWSKNPATCSIPTSGSPTKRRSTWPSSREIRCAATAAVDEFDKVVRVRATRSSNSKPLPPIRDAHRRSIGDEAVRAYQRFRRVAGGAAASARRADLAQRACATSICRPSKSWRRMSSTTPIASRFTASSFCCAKTH